VSTRLAPARSAPLVLGHAGVAPLRPTMRPALRPAPWPDTGGLDDRVFDVLLVEDNPGDVRLVREALAETGTRVDLHVAGDGEAALSWLREPGPGGATRRPDLLLLDLNLPRRGGLEVLADLKADPLLRPIPVVVLSSSAAEHDVTGAYERYANCFVTKPLGLEAFIAAVREIARFWLGSASLPRR
jgi:chemotaxis family two-component system response regulator Rcp1